MDPRPRGASAVAHELRSAVKRTDFSGHVRPIIVKSRLLTCGNGANGQLGALQSDFDVGGEKRSFLQVPD